MEQMIVRKRRVIGLGKSLYSVIPHEFAQKHSLKKGDSISITVGEELLKVLPFSDSLEDTHSEKLHEI